MERSPKPWQEARDECIKLGADLATFKTLKELNFLNSVFIEEADYWVGASDLEVQDEWKWVDGTDMDMKFFHKKEPNSGNQRCVVIWDDAYGVGDGYCYTENIFLCEYKPRLVRSIVKDKDEL